MLGLMLGLPQLTSHLLHDSEMKGRHKCELSVPTLSIESSKNGHKLIKRIYVSPEAGQFEERREMVLSCSICRLQ